MLAPENDTLLENRWAPEVRIKEGYSWGDKMGIAIKILVEEEKMALIEWIKQVSSSSRWHAKWLTVP